MPGHSSVVNKVEKVENLCGGFGQFITQDLFLFAQGGEFFLCYDVSPSHGQTVFPKLLWHVTHPQGSAF